MLTPRPKCKIAALGLLIFLSCNTEMPDSPDISNTQSRPAYIPGATVKLEDVSKNAYLGKTTCHPTAAIIPKNVTCSLYVNDTTRGHANVNLPKNVKPPKADIIFVMDLTGSMGEELNNLLVNSINIMQKLKSLIPDSRFGVISHMDYTNFYTECDYNNYYGLAPYDYPYRINQNLTTNSDSVSNAINSLDIGSGLDQPENYTRVLFESYSDSTISWRKGAKRILIFWNDNVPHDCNYLLNCGGTGSTGAEPGRDMIAGTDDDLSLDLVLQDISKNNISLLILHSGYFLQLWECYMSKCGGNAFQINGNGTIPDGADIALFIKEKISRETGFIDQLTLSVCEPQYSNWLISVTPEMFTNIILNTDKNFAFDYVIKVPDGTAEGTYTFDICALGDGVEYAKQNVKIIVLPEIMFGHPPFAEAGTNRTLEQSTLAGSEVILDGSGSSDPDDDILSFKWLKNSTFIAEGLTVKDTFQLGIHNIILVVTDSTGFSDTDEVTINITDNIPPSISNLPDTITEEQKNHYGAKVTLKNPTVTDVCDVAPHITNNAPVTFPHGLTGVAFKAKDASGNISTGTTVVKIVDTKPPKIKSLTANPDRIWPPDQRMVPVNVFADVNDVADSCPTCKIIRICSNEQTCSNGSTEPDWEFVNDMDIKLRADTTCTPQHKRIYTVTVQCTDKSGNSAQRKVKIRVSPESTNTSVIVSAGSDQIVEQASLSGTEIILDGSGSANFDSSSAVFNWYEGNTLLGSGCVLKYTFQLGRHNIKMVLSDSSGVSDSDQITISIVDNTPPVLSNIPASITADQELLRGTRIDIGLPTVTDVCDASPKVTSDKPGIFPAGITTVTFKATDASGNISKATMTVTIIDKKPPQIKKLTATPNRIWPPNGRFVPVVIKANVFDLGDTAPQCKIINICSNRMQCSNGSGLPDWEFVNDMEIRLKADTSCSQNGRRIYTVTVQSVDKSGNSSTGIVKITVAPDAKPFTAHAGADQIIEQATLAGSVVTLNGSRTHDPDKQVTSYKWFEGNTLLAENKVADYTFQLGIHNVKLIVSNSTGVSDTDNTIINITDKTPPVLSNIPVPVIMELTDCNGTPVSLTLPVFTDICDASPIVTSNAPALFPIGITNVTFTATDASGNQTRASVDVKITDNSPPVFSNIPVPITAEQNNPEGTRLIVPLPQVTDNCSMGITLKSDAPKIFPPGTTTVTFTAKDAYGNVTTTSTTVTVKDTRPPIIRKLSAEPNFLWPPDARMVSVSIIAVVNDVADTNPSYKITSICSNKQQCSDGSSELDWEFIDSMRIKLRADTICTPRTGRIYTITVESKDKSGNSKQKKMRIRVSPDSQSNQTGAFAGMDQTLEQTSLAGTPVVLDGTGSVAPDSTEIISYKWFEGNTLLSQDSITTQTFQLGIHNVKLVTGFSNGKTDNDQVVIKVVDKTPPVIGNVPETFLKEVTSCEPVSIVLPLPTVTDICDASPDFSNNAPVEYPIGVTKVNYTAIDASGNKSHASTIVTVAERTPPVISNIPDPITAEQKNTSGTLIDIPFPTVTDNCDAKPVITSDAPVRFPFGMTTVTFTAIDFSGNVSTAKTTVTVTDTTPPRFRCLCAQPGNIWPPDNSLVPVTITAEINDNSDKIPSYKILDICSNKQQCSSNQDSLPDWEIIDSLHIKLRADTSCTPVNTNRIYFITIQSKDKSGNTAQRVVSTRVSPIVNNNTDCVCNNSSEQ